MVVHTLSGALKTRALKIEHKEHVLFKKKVKWKWVQFRKMKQVNGSGHLKMPCNYRKESSNKYNVSC